VGAKKVLSVWGTSRANSLVQPGAVRTEVQRIHLIHTISYTHSCILTCFVGRTDTWCMCSYPLRSEPERTHLLVGIAAEKAQDPLVWTMNVHGPSGISSEWFIVTEHSSIAGANSPSKGVGDNHNRAHSRNLRPCNGFPPRSPVSGQRNWDRNSFYEWAMPRYK
jgi:hypothetical protein